MAPTKTKKSQIRRKKSAQNNPIKLSENTTEISKFINIPPDLPKKITDVVRPAYFVKQKSISSISAKFAKALKEKADNTVNTLTGNKKILDEDLGLASLTIPVLKEDFSTETKNSVENVTLEKRWVQKETSINVPVSYEHLFINGEELRFGFGEALNQIKEKILEIIPVEQDKEKEEKNIWVPLYGRDTEMDKTIPLYAEEVIISKRKVKVGEIKIRKREVTKDEKIQVDLITENVFVENPD
jgi:stress response protein YsnF